MSRGKRADRTVQWGGNVRLHRSLSGILFASMLPLPGLARHAALYLAAPCYAGAAPLMAPLCCAIYRTPRKQIPRLARPAWPLSLALCVCVCVGCVNCDAPVPVDVPLAFGSAVVCYAIASAFCCFGRLFCSRFRFRVLV